MTRQFTISFSFSFEAKQLSVYLNKVHKLAQLKLTLTNLNNLSVVLNSSKRANNHLNVEELVYLLADDLANHLDTDPKQAFLFKCYFQIDAEFKQKLSEFLLEKLDELYRLKYEQIRTSIDVEQLKEHWLQIIDKNCVVVNESSLTSIDTLGRPRNLVMVGSLITNSVLN